MVARKKPRVVTVNDSSQIKLLSYDPSSKTMQIRFTNDTTYIYMSVPPKVFGELISAESVGSYFAKNIRDTYPGTKVAI